MIVRQFKHRPGSGMAVVAVVLAALLGGGAWAQSAPVPAAAPEFTADELESLVAPVALYPDDLLAIVLPASTYPLQVVQAARFLEAARTDTTLEPDEAWDDSVVALLNYPEVLELLSDDLDWTWELGQAVLAQQPDVMAAVAGFRARAHAAGNLRSDDRQIVEVADDVIYVRPADPEVIYVPYYEPARVIVRQAAPVYYYYPRAYPVYYYPYPVGYTFYSGFFWGVTAYYSLGWTTRHVHVHHHHHHWHPFYRKSYHYDRFYYRRPTTVVHHTYHQPPRTPRYYTGNKWQPDRHRTVTSRPGRTSYRGDRTVRSEDRTVRSGDRTHRPRSRDSARTDSVSSFAAPSQRTDRRADQRPGGQRIEQRPATTQRPAAQPRRSFEQRAVVQQRSSAQQRPSVRQRPAGQQRPAQVASAPRDRTPAASPPPTIRRSEPTPAQRQPAQRAQAARPQIRSAPAQAQRPQVQQRRSEGSSARSEARESRAPTAQSFAQGRGSDRSAGRANARGTERRSFSPR